MTPQPFRIDVAAATIDDLRARLARTRWPEAVAGAGWAAGTDPEVLRDWCARWRQFDWQAQADRLNRLAQFRWQFEGVELHFVHARGEGAGATPLLLMNGWPSSFAELVGLIGPLTRAEGGAPVFDVVIPSLPGYGFSGRPAEPGWNISRMARAMAALMSALGYTRFGVHGSDMGAGVMLALARQVPERLIGMHALNVYWGYPPVDDADPAETSGRTKAGRGSRRRGPMRMCRERGRSRSRRG